MPPVPPARVSQIHKVLSSTPNHLPPSLGQTNSSSSRVGPGLSRRPRGVLLDEDSCHNTSDSVFGHHGNVGGRPGSADFSHNTSSSNSPVNFRDSVDCQPRSASLSSDDIMGLSRSQLTLSRSSTLPYDQTPQRAQPQRGGGVKTKTRSSSPGSQMVTLEEFLQESNVQSPPMVRSLCVCLCLYLQLSEDQKAYNPQGVRTFWLIWGL
uniref:protein Daple-like n=1 Tax=Solea senegalensis TaxID=28829 RepID=UPI001CD8D7F5|nr:protein Daple-like [Solea senegalensis]